MILSRSAGKEILLQCMRPWFDSWVGKICWRRDRLPTPVFLGFIGGSAGKESAYTLGDLGSIPRLGRSPGEGKGHWLQNSGLENSMDHIVHGVAKSWTWLNNFHSLGRMNRGYKDKKILLFHQVLDMKPKFFNTVNYIYPCFLLLLATIKKKPTMLSIR